MNPSSLNSHSPPTSPTSSANSSSTCSSPMVKNKNISSLTPLDIDPLLERQSTTTEHKIIDEETNVSMFWRLILLLIAGVNYLLQLVWGFIGIVIPYTRNKNRIALLEAYEAISKAQSYVDWEKAAKQLDNLRGVDEWKSQIETKLYDYKTVQHRLESLRTLSRSNDIHSLLFMMRSGLLRNLGGIGNVRLFHYSVHGTKKLVEEYTEEVAKILEYICDNDFEDLTLNKKFDFFYELRQTFGRSALLLSGGSTLGMYHLGVIKCLYEEKLLPRVMSGSSVGSIIASLVCVLTDEELEQAFLSKAWNLNAFDKLKSGSLKRKFIRLIRNGYLMESSTFFQCVRENLGDITFKEAYDKTKRILNISVASADNFEFPRLLNYITAPNVLIWSAACASCALPFLFAPVELMAKDKKGNIVPYHPSGQKWIDGSVGADLPMTRLSELFNVNHFIVSQVNPHVAPFLYQFEAKKGTFITTAMYLLKSELKHRVTQLQELGLIPKLFSNLHPFITQKYRGDITIVPKIPLKHYTKLVSNPTQEMIQECISKGKESTFPKLGVIRQHCLIEFTLERCFDKLTHQIYQNDLNKHKQPAVSPSSSSSSSYTYSSSSFPSTSSPLVKKSPSLEFRRFPGLVSRNDVAVTNSNKSDTHDLVNKLNFVI